jgi:hypothetical protein
MNRHHLAIFVLCLLTACSTVKEKKTDAEDKAHYNSLILNVVTNNLLEGHTKDPNYPFFELYNGFIYDTASILKIKKEVNDPSIGVKMRMHKWSGMYGADSRIFYFTDNQGFEFTYFFKDNIQFNYWGEDIRKGAIENDQEKKNREDRRKAMQAIRMKFSDYLTYLTYRLKLKSPDTVKKFMHLFADSLLGLKELTVKDTSFIKQVITRRIKEDSSQRLTNYLTDDLYLVNLKSNIGKLVSDLKNNSYISAYNTYYIHYYTMPGMGTDVFWKFTIKQYTLTDNWGKEKAPTVWYLSADFINGDFKMHVYL